jgi:hypothetical protein
METEKEGANPSLVFGRNSEEQGWDNSAHLHTKGPPLPPRFFHRADKLIFARHSPQRPSKFPTALFLRASCCCVTRKKFG